MLISRNAERQWKKSVEQALCPEQLAAERGRLSTEMAMRLWVANGGQTYADAASEGTLVVLETLIGNTLDTILVRASAALRHLAGLEQALANGDYEDSPALRQELRWSATRLKSETGGVAGANDPTAPTLPGSYGRALTQLHTALFEQLAATLKAAEIAA